jgi:hypothetical protein
MSHEQVLQTKVHQLRTRIRMLLAQQAMVVGVTYAAVAGLLLVAATRFQVWTDAVDFLWALLLIGAVTGLLIGWTRRITPLIAAQIADERGGLKERLSTAVELAAQESRSEVAEAQIADAARHAQDLRVSEVMPWRAPRQLRFLAGAVAVLLAAIFLPDLPLFQSAQERADREALRFEGQRIQRVAKEMEKKLAKKKKGEDESDAILRRIARNMKQLGKEQSRNRVSKKQAMLKMNELTKQLKEAENRMTGGKAEKSLEKVAAEMQQRAVKEQAKGNGEGAKALQKMAESISKQDMEAAKKQLEELAKKIQDGKLSAEEMQKAAEMLQQMAQSMDGSTLKEASQQMKDAAQKLQQAAKTAQQMQQKMQQAKSDAERQQIQQQMQQQVQQAMQSAAEQTECAGGT